jgi:hypothetical protein
MKYASMALFAGLCLNMQGCGGGCDDAAQEKAQECTMEKAAGLAGGGGAGDDVCKPVNELLDCIPDACCDVVGAGSADGKTFGEGLKEMSEMFTALGLDCEITKCA